MNRQIDWNFRVRELMARAGMRNSRDLVEPLHERGITLSESQIYRLVSQNPDRISFQVFVSLCDIFNVEPNDLLTYTAADIRTKHRPAAVGQSTDVPLLEAYRPVRARVDRGNQDE
ncbi:helix-turn-helix transcriptional regulator [Frigoribacterium sp. PhB118]|uniref:helix-turn-helix domain-containing protein n=1 Tax=Frigoribacterium sp. PhB118 TaxID=2485175 RepID=UPI000F4992D2|nr:helix-turn-helix transcriptional regulator [Frigoribacterium sp. PhB118]ROS56581.1 DNA-binding Xre family transcriptional regulator [Frigoribacterium sp. PhB118]